MNSILPPAARRRPPAAGESRYHSSASMPATDVFQPVQMSKAKNLTGGGTDRLPEPDALVQKSRNLKATWPKGKQEIPSCPGVQQLPSSSLQWSSRSDLRGKRGPTRRSNDRADSSRWSSEKRVVVYSAFGASLVALGLGVFSAAKYLSAQSELDKGTFRYGDCTTQTDCARLKELSNDQHAWFQRTVALSFTSLGLIASGTVLGLVLPNGTTVAPTASASRDGANLTLSGTF